MPRLVVRVVGFDFRLQREFPMSELESDRYDPNHLQNQISIALDFATQSVAGVRVSELRNFKPKVSVVLDTGRETGRPCVHLGQRALSKLLEAGATFDFEPYTALAGVADSRL